MLPSVIPGTFFGADAENSRAGLTMPGGLPLPPGIRAPGDRHGERREHEKHPFYAPGIGPVCSYDRSTGIHERSRLETEHRTVVSKKLLRCNVRGNLLP
jgi:hypothetical protein